MSGVTSASMVGVSSWSRPVDSGSSADESGKSSAFTNATVSSPIATTSFGWTMWSSRVNQPRAAAGSSVPNLRQLVP